MTILHATSVTNVCTNPSVDDGVGLYAVFAWVQSLQYYNPNAVVNTCGTRPEQCPCN
jgi:hypothetical protein